MSSPFISSISFTENYGDSIALKKVALYDSRDLTTEQAIDIINSGETDRHDIVTMPEETYKRVFRSLMPEEKPEEVPEDDPSRPHKGEHAWAVVKDSGSFRLMVIPVIITETDNRVFQFIHEKDEKKPRGFAVTTYTTAREEWLKTVFPDEERAKKAMTNIIASSRFDPT